MNNPVVITLEAVGTNEFPRWRIATRDGRYWDGQCWVAKRHQAVLYAQVDAASRDADEILRLEYDNKPCLKRITVPLIIEIRSDEPVDPELLKAWVKKAATMYVDSRTRRSRTERIATMGGDTIGKMRVGGVDRVERWIAAHSTWKRSLRSVVSRVKQVFKWGADNGYIASSPIKALKRPRDNSRFALLTAEQVAAILFNSEPPFSLAFRSLLATGCRPEEFTSLTRVDVKEDVDGELYWWVEHKNQGYTGSRRRVFLTDEMQQITRQQMKRYPHGTLFRNASGGAWSPVYLNNTFRVVCATPECAALNLNNSNTLKRLTSNPSWSTSE